jgi:hypothetical protein
LEEVALGFSKFALANSKTQKIEVGLWYPVDIPITLIIIIMKLFNLIPDHFSGGFDKI